MNRAGAKDEQRGDDRKVKKKKKKEVQNREEKPDGMRSTLQFKQC